MPGIKREIAVPRSREIDRGIRPRGARAAIDIKRHQQIADALETKQEDAFDCSGSRPSSSKPRQRPTESIGGRDEPAFAARIDLKAGHFLSVW